MRAITYLLYPLVIVFAFQPKETLTRTSAQEKIAMRAFPVTLYVGTKTSYLNPVNITATVDVKDTLVDRDFYAPRPFKDGHSAFTFTLRAGVHQFIVSSKNGDAGLDVVLPIDKPTWIVVDYWGKNHFQFFISYTAITFD